MKLRIAYERSINVLASGLAMVAQRLPFLKNLSPFLSGGSGMKFAAPLTVSFVGTHALSGQSITIVPIEVGDSTTDNPATVGVGEEFLWAFISSEHSLGGVKVEIDGVETTPPGIEVSSSAGIYFLAGNPTEAGVYDITITGFRFAARRGTGTAPFQLTLNVEAGEEPSTPFEDFVATFWSGDDLNDPLVVGATADPDEDGISNEMEFVLDLDPTKPEKMPGEFGIDPNDPEKIRYEIALNEDAANVSVKLEKNVNLGADWEDVSEENYTRTDTALIFSAPMDEKMFFRLKVTLPED